MPARPQLDLTQRRQRAASLALAIILPLALPPAGCSDDDGARGDASADARRDAGTPPDTLPPDSRPGEALPRSALSCTTGTDCPPCVEGSRGCAAQGPEIAETCCRVGDNLEALGEARGSEVVDLETNGTYAIACGGFGADISDIRDPRAPGYVGSASPRCQRVAFGGTAKPDGQQIVYLAHHGDSWVKSPFLATYQIGDGGKISNVDTIEDDKVLFEGLAYHDEAKLLYVAAHDGGVRVYDVAGSDGKPKLVTVVSWPGNAWKLALDVTRKTAYVADQHKGLVVLDLADPRAPKVGATVATSAPPRDVVVDTPHKRVLLALGGGGVDVFDASDAAKPTLSRTLAGRGSAQAVAVGGGVIAVAAWNHLAVYDAETLAPLGVQRVRRSFEQDLGVAVVDRGGATGPDDTPLIIVGEWEGLHTVAYHAGRVGPRLWIDEDILTLDPNRPDAALIVHNIGLLPLKVRDVTLTNSDFTVTKTGLSVAPGDRDFFEVRKPGAPSGQTTLTLLSDDPDPDGAARRLPVNVSQGSRIDVGDTLDASFGFLDPSGAGQLSGLQGKVIVLSYFALF